MNRILAGYFLLLTFCLHSQTIDTFNGEEKAYMYHVVMKSPILKVNIGRYFEYSGPKIFWRDTILNYDSMEVLIINQPDLLFIRTSEIAKSPPGIIAELSNKMALWELNLSLLAYQDKDNPELLRYKNKFESFKKLLIENLPSVALTKDQNGVITFQEKIMKVINPSLAFNDKTALLSSFYFLTIDDQAATLKGINQSVNAWVKKRSYELFTQLGGSTNHFENQLIAAGDGSNTSGLLNEREKDESGRWNRGLPKAVGLFPYQFHIEPLENSKQSELVSERFATLNFQTIGQNRQTNIHPDVWGYNDKKQTTVVIEKKGKSYVLFGSGDTRFLSPDSTFSTGATFYALIKELENKWIKDLNERIYGKKGIEADITFWKGQVAVAFDKIKVTEIGISSMNVSTLSTTKQGKKQRAKDQQKLITMNERLSYCQAKVKYHENEKDKALIILESYKKKLEKYKQLIGYSWIKWTEKNLFYTFEDGATFNLYTQEFRFPATESPESFEVRLLAVPYSALSKQADEVMLHLSITDVEPGFDRTIQLVRDDLFPSNSYALQKDLFSQKDSVAVLEVFELLLKKPTVEIIARGQGIATWEDGTIKKMSPPIEENSYPGASKEERLLSKMDSTYSRLRKTELFVGPNDETIQIEINSYTDPVRTDFEPQNVLLKEMIASKKISNNDALSVYRTAALLNQLKSEFNLKAGMYLTREQAKIVIDHLNKAIQQTRIAVGTSSIALSEL